MVQSGQDHSLLYVGKMTQPTTNTTTIIAAAIKSMRLLGVRYHDKARVLEPYLLGTYADERQFLLAWMVHCVEDPEKSPGWQHYLLSGMQSVEVLPGNFDGTRPGYNPVSDSRVRHVIAAVPGR
jgi:hypothetical protein